MAPSTSWVTDEGPEEQHDATRGLRPGHRAATNIHEHLGPCQPDHADGPCRRTMPPDHAAGPCRRTMPTDHADGPCRRTMPPDHAGGAKHARGDVDVSRRRYAMSRQELSGCHPLILPQAVSVRCRHAPQEETSDNRSQHTRRRLLGEPSSIDMYAPISTHMPTHRSMHMYIYTQACMHVYTYIYRHVNTPFALRASIRRCRRLLPSSAPSTHSSVGRTLQAPSGRRRCSRTCMAAQWRIPRRLSPMANRLWPMA